MKKTRVNLSYYIILIALMLVSITINLVGDSLSSNGVQISFTILTQVLAMFILPIACYFLIIKPKSTVKECMEDFGFKHFKEGELIKVIGLGFIAIFLNTVFAHINYGLLSLIGYTYPHSSSSDYVNNIGMFFLDIVLTAMLPAICEETAHRGLFRISYGDKPVKYILISSALFALMHQNIAQVIYTFCTGILFACAVVYTGNLKASMIIHFMVNATEIISDLGLQLNSPILAIKPLIFSVLGSNVVGVIFMVILAVLLLYLYFKLLYSFKMTKQKFDIEKAKRLLVDGTLAVNFLDSDDKDSKMAKVLLFAIILCGVLANVFTLAWGLIR